MSIEDQANYMRYQREMIDAREETATQFIKGKTEGKAEGVEAVAKAMKQNCFSLEDIAKCTGLTLEKIQNI